jgi:cobalt-precorrin 5A hydrolase
LAARHAGDAVAAHEVVIAAGLGFRAGSSLAELERGLDAALAAHGRSLSELGCLSVADFKRADSSLAELVARLGKPLYVCSPLALRAGPPTLTQSSEILRRYGVGSISEACALAGALAHGKQARLLGTRVIAGSVTCALAISEQLELET